MFKAPNNLRVTPRPLSDLRGVDLGFGILAVFASAGLALGLPYTSERDFKPLKHMKMKSTIFSLMIGLSVISVVQLNAQSRGRDRGGDRERSDSRDRSDNKEQRERYANNNDHKRNDHDRNDRDRNDHVNNNRDRRDNNNWKNDRDHDRGNHYGRDNNRHNHGRTVVRHVHVHDRYCHRRPVVVHHHYTRPRYVYYRDYDVYYDYTRNVYFSYSGRNWSMSTAIPIGMRHTNLRQVKRYEIDYYDDDFNSYLDNGRPAYGKECDW